MLYDFSEDKKAKKYLDFCLSDDGKKQQQLIWRAVKPLLPKEHSAKVLDVGCGNGWLSGKLSEQFREITAFDSSGKMLEYAKQYFPQVNFIEADFQEDLPFKDSAFDFGIASLVMHDLPDLKHGFKELFRVIAEGGRLLVVDLNPYYSHPVGSWKRNIWQKLTRIKPTLKLRPYMDFKRRADRSFAWGENYSLFYTLPEMINTAIDAGFRLDFIDDIGSETESDKLDIGYRSYRFPTFMIYQFSRTTASK